MPESINLQSASKIHAGSSEEAHGLHKLTGMLLYERLEDSDRKVRDEVKYFDDRQKRVEYLDRYVRQLNSSLSDESEGLSKAEFNELVEEGLKLKQEAESRMEEADNLERELIALKESGDVDQRVVNRMEKQIKWLRDSIDEIHSALQACDIIDKEKNLVEGSIKYTKNQVTRIMENIRSYSKILNTRNTTQMQIVTRYSQDRNIIIELAKPMERLLHEMYKKPLSNIR